jgi:enoyl-CoA hydratase/carnithine racemase
MTDEVPAVLLECRGAALWITLNRPDKRNAINRQVLDGIAAGYRLAQEDPQVRVIVLTGAGDRAFCAGADLEPGESFSFDFARPTTPYADLLRQAHQATVPSIAVVNGACLAGGMGLLAMTDLAIAADDVAFGLPEVKLGLFPMQVLSLLQELVPRRMVREWCLSGESFDAATAAAAGLVNYVVPRGELRSRADWLVGRIVDKSPAAIRRGKYALRAFESLSFDEGIAFAESQIGLASMTEDAREGLRSFVEKRKPSFSGR